MRRTSQHNLSIVGAGITGLILAYRAHRNLSNRCIIVHDEGPDPRTRPNFSHTYGATYSGYDARHISVTETGPWTSSHRIELIARSAAEGGWNCLASERLTNAEQAWLDDFRRIARRPQQHTDNYDTIMSINQTGLEGWAELMEELPDIFKPTNDHSLLPILCTNPEDLASEQAAEFLLDPMHVSPAIKRLPPEASLLEAKRKSGDLYGSFLVAGTAFNVRTLCTKLISWLSERGVQFEWNRPVDLVSDGTLDVPAGDVVFAAGVSTKSTALMKRAGLLLQGVAGCWLDIPNPGFTYPFKILGPEPVNFINVTPADNRLLVSGGYGWVGERTYDEARVLFQPTIDAFNRSIAQFFSVDEADIRVLPNEVCIRPALPSGVPAISQLDHVDTNHRLFVCVGHGAGGFTMAPAVASRVLELL